MARQRLGQHFLHSRGVLERLAAAACPGRESLVIEIGPGRGALTEFLLPRCDRLIVIEIDPRMIAALRERFGELEIVERDILEVDLGQWGPAVVAGNLPYYITSPIVDKVCRLGGLLRRSVLLMQQEVADRLVAGPGSRDYGYLSVTTQLFATPEILFGVPPGAFSPPPKVDSAAVRLLPRLPVPADADAFLEFAGRAFQHKRKTLRNNLAPYYGAQVAEWAEARLRAEQLPLEALREIWGRLHLQP